MNQESLTAKSQEALQKAVEMAQQNSNQAIENVHLLLGIEQVDHHLFSYIIQRCETKPGLCLTRSKRNVRHFPR